MKIFVSLIYFQSNLQVFSDKQEESYKKDNSALQIDYYITQKLVWFGLIYSTFSFSKNDFFFLINHF